MCLFCGKRMVQSKFLETSRHQTNIFILGIANLVRAVEDARNYELGKHKLENSEHCGVQRNTC